MAAPFPFLEKGVLRMRKLMWFAIGFCVSCGLFVYFISEEWIATGCIAALLCAAVLHLFGKGQKHFRQMALIFLGFVLGAGWYGVYYSHYLALPAELDGKTVSATIRTSDFSEETDYGIVTEGRMTLEGKDYRVRLWLDRKEPLGPGYCVAGPFQFRMTAPEEDPASYYSGNGVFLLAFQKGEICILQDSRITWTDRVSRLRQWLRDMIHSCFPSDAEPFACALLLGDTSLLDYETDTNFKVSGIRHVVAVN